MNNILEEKDVEDCNFYITKFNSKEDALSLDIILNFQDYENDLITQHWVIEAFAHEKSQFHLDFFESIEIKNDHPLLWEFTDLQCQLYFSGECKDQPKLFYDLYQTHKRIFWNYLNFDLPFIFIEGNSSYRPFQFTNGLLSQGSKKLMLEYASCLQQNGLDYRIIGERPAQNRHGQQFNFTDQNLKILLLGNSYVIAKNFLFTQKE